jgi:hypothetical protein
VGIKADSVYRMLKAEIEDEGRFWQGQESLDDVSPRWVIGLLEIGRKDVLVTLQWFVWKPYRWFGGKLRYKPYQHGDPVSVPYDDLEIQGFVKDNFLTDIYPYLPSDIRTQVCYELDDVVAVIGWEKLRDREKYARRSIV